MNHRSLAVSRGRIVTLEKRSVGGRNREFCVALEADSGAELCAVDLDVAQYTDPVGYDDRMDGPRSTPSIAGDRVYAFTSQLKLHALRADTGALVWSRDFPAELGSSVIAWENAASPLVVGDLVLVNCNAPRAEPDGGAHRRRLDRLGQVRRRHDARLARVRAHRRRGSGCIPHALGAGVGFAGERGTAVALALFAFLDVNGCFAGGLG